jgi:hypothetical protein
MPRMSKKELQKLFTKSLIKKVTAGTQPEGKKLLHAIVKKIKIPQENHKFPQD